MINKRLDEIEENIKEINKMIKDDKYFKSLEKSIEYVNHNSDKLKKEIKRYKKVLDKIKEYIKNTEELYLVENYEEEGLMTPIKNIKELLEEIE